MTVKEQANAIIEVCRAVIATVKEAKEVPAGTVYAALMAQGCTLAQYQQIESLCLETGLITKRGDLLCAA